MTVERHRTWSFHRVQRYDFVRDLLYVPLTLSETPSAAACFPLVFVTGGSGVMPHVLLRRGPTGQTAFVGVNGQWQAPWLPPRLSVWPFDLVDVPGMGQGLGIHEESDFVTKGVGGIPIFVGNDDMQATLSPEMKVIVNLLRQHCDALQITGGAATILADLGLLTPLDSNPACCIIDQPRVDCLDESEVLALHEANALALVYAACVSLVHLPWMEKVEALSAAGHNAAVRAVNKKATASTVLFLAALSKAQSRGEPRIQLPTSSPL